MRARILTTVFMALALAAPLHVPASARALPGVEPGVLHATQPSEIIVRFRQRIPAAIPGATIRYRFTAEPAVFAIATPHAVRALAARADVAYIEANKPIEFQLDSAVRASRAADVWAPSEGEPLRDAAGNVIDGRGIGIAIVDTGLDGLHPDYFETGKVGGNWQVTAAGVVPLPTTSNANEGHGTHVAGIVAGTGDASGGIFRGAAPGATIYALNMFTGVDGTVILPAVAFQWILDHGASQDPPIRVVNNSWTCAPRICRNTFNPDQLHARLASKLSESGFVVTWSAGNDGGDGTTAMTNASSINPTPGIISVANYADERATTVTGVRDNRVSSTSSRGDSTDPATWPDVAAPGSAVTSTWATVARTEGQRFGGRNPVTGENTYLLLSGTSMAAPHVAGIVAMMLQANPGLTPAEVEYLLKATATKLPNPAGYVRASAVHPYDGANHMDGHGLVDARAAVETATSFAGIPVAPEPEPIPAWFVLSVPGIEVQQRLYLTGDGGFQASYPTGSPTPNTGRINELVTYTSAPFATETRFDALTGDVFFGTTQEWFVATHASLQLRMIARRIDASGTMTELGEAIQRVAFTPTLAPNHRRFTLHLPAEAVLEPGDRLDVAFSYRKRPGSDSGASDAVLTDGVFTVYAGDPTASVVGLGRTVRHPPRGGSIDCRAREYCAEVGGDDRIRSVTCGAVATRVRWRGPAGSSILLSCDGFTLSCTVPGTAGRDPDGECQQTADLPGPTSTQADGICTYRTDDGMRAGSGRCEALTLLRA